MADILISDVQSDYLNSGALDADELELLIGRAERKTLNRYRETNAHQSQDLLGSAYYDGDIRLDGYVEDDNGDPDLDEMDAGLLDALRSAIAEIVEFWTRKPGVADHVESKSQGARSVSFRDKSLLSSVYSSLRPYDERTPFF